MATLKILNGPEVGQETELVQEVFFIGRDPNNHLVLSDRTVSRKHAVINQLEGEFVLSDLKSLKGVLINGVKTEEATLEDGDEIAIGAVRLRFHTGLKEKMIPPSPKKRTGVRILITLVILLLIGGGIFFWQRERRLRTVGPDLATIQMNYEEGVRLFNEEKNIAGAKAHWEKVLQLDPQQTTPFAHKAVKLLENLQ